MNHNRWHRIGNERLPMHALIWVWDTEYGRPVLVKWDGNEFDRDLRGRNLTHWRHIDIPTAP